MIVDEIPDEAPPARFDPTWGKIDFDIQDYVEAMEPESIAQRVAIQNTLQNRRDRGEVLYLP